MKYHTRFMVRRALPEEDCSVCRKHDHYLVIPRNYGTHGGKIYCETCFKLLPNSEKEWPPRASKN